MEFKPFALAVASLFLFYFLQYSPHLTNAETTNLLSNFCHKSRHPRFCMKMFASDPRAPKAKDYNDVAAIVLDTASNTVKDYTNYVKRLRKTNHAKALAVCAENYDVASNSLGGSLDELADDPMTANYDAKAGSDGARICKDAIAEAKLQIPTIANKNAKIQLYSDIGYDITDITTTRTDELGRILDQNRLLM